MRTWKLAPGLCALASIALAAPAGANAATSFNCRASAVRAGTFEPTLSGNSSSPCLDLGKTGTGSSSGALQVGATGAFTHVNDHFQGRGAGSFAYASNVSISSGKVRISIASAQSQVVDKCAATNLVSTGQDTVTGLTVNGRQIADTATTARIEVSNDGSYIQLNQASPSASALTRTAAFVHLVGVGDITIAEAIVTHTSGACAHSGSQSAAVDPCPLGSAYDPGSHLCVITVPKKPAVVVSPPFLGPAGGRVFALGATTLKSPCLRKKGSSYVLVALPGAGLVTGTNGPDRIIAIGGNYEIKGRNGRDCIDAVSGNDVIRDGNGKDRIFASLGFDQILLGNGRDAVYRGPGGGTIKAGNGNDKIFGGSGFTSIKLGKGNDVIHAGPGVTIIKAGNGRDKVFAGPGHDKITVGNGNDVITGSLGFDEISAGTGSDIITTAAGRSVVLARGRGAQVRCGIGVAQVRVPAAAVPFAQRHGCKTVSAL